MKTFKMMALFLCLIFMLAGCTKSNVSAEDLVMNGPGATQEAELIENFERKPLFEEDEELETMFDWEQVDADATYLFDDKDYYPLGVEMAYEVNEEKKTIKLMWILLDGTTEAEAMEYAAELVRKFNNIMATQSTDVDFAEANTFGTLWEMFGLTVQISTEDGTMMIDKSYRAGEAIDLDLPTYSEGGPVGNAEAQISPGNK